MPTYPTRDSIPVQNVQDFTGLQVLTRATANLPQTAQGDLFTISGGAIQLLSIIGEVTTVIQTQANNTKLVHNPTGTGADVDLCAVLDITADAVGTVYSITGTLATAMKSTSLWLVAPADNIPWPGLILLPGTIALNCAASNSGQVKWIIMYKKLETASAVVAA